MGTTKILKTTCPRDCYDSCGMTVLVEDGTVRRVRGDAEHGVSRGHLCGKCALAYNGAWIDPQQRLLQPLKRCGRKGAAEFVAVTWEEALSDIAGRLVSICSSGRPELILHTHYTGTCSLIAGNFPIRFFRRLGATEVDPDTICNKAGHEALRYVLGESLTGFDPRTAKDTSCVLVWGANPSTSAPHLDQYWLSETPGCRIVVDPVGHQTARKADLFLQLRPGTDAILAFSMMHVAQAAGLIADEFIARSVLGWEMIREDVMRMDPEHGAQLTGVPAALIREAALIYATGPSLLWIGQGMQRQLNGGNAVRSIATLCAVTGNIGMPGTGLLYVNGPGTRGIDMDYLTAAHLSAKQPPPISQMDLVDRLSDCESSNALVCWNNNILASNPAQEKLRKALAREDLFHIVIDLFQTDTADYADYVLPAASFLEFDDVLLPYFENSVSPVVKASEPLGCSLPNQEIFRKLAEHMGFEDVELAETDSAMIENILRQVGWKDDFRSLAAQGTFYPSADPMIAFEEGVFPTPSGRIEIASLTAVRDGYPLTPMPIGDVPPQGGRIRVLSPGGEFSMNSSHSNDPRVLRRMGPPLVRLNAFEAARRELTEGQAVLLHNESGELALTVCISDVVPPGVALIYKGRWPKLDKGGANVNVLNPGLKSDLGDGNAVHSVEAYLRPLTQTRPGKIQ